MWGTGTERRGIMTKRIELTKGKFAIVDDEDFDFLSQWKWWIDSQGYAVRDEGGRKNKRRILMHRFLNNTPDGYHTDHLNRKKLDNRRSNLMTRTCSQNILNSKLSKRNTSGFKGVEWYKNRWVARIKIGYKNIYLGRFKNIADAIKARQEAELKYAI
jgi:hypothetical protein